MKVERKKITLDRGTVIVIVTESLSIEELASYDPTKADKIPQSYIMIGPDEKNLARIDGLELALLSNIIQIVGGMSSAMGRNLPSMVAGYPRQ